MLNNSTSNLFPYKSIQRILQLFYASVIFVKLSKKYYICHQYLVKYIHTYTQKHT